MPILDFIHEESGETITLQLGVNEPKEKYWKQEIDGKIYRRVVTTFHFSKDSRGGTTESDFIRKTSNKKLKVGEMQSISREMHEKRVEKEGVDKAKEQYYKDYELNIGQKHQNVVNRDKKAARNKRLEKAKKNLSHFGVKVDLNAK